MNLREPIFYIIAQSKRPCKGKKECRKILKSVLLYCSSDKMISQKTKEEFSVKTTIKKHAAYSYVHQPLYPNVADTNYFSEKALEILTAIASGMGCVAGMIFLVIMA